MIALPAKKIRYEEILTVYYKSYPWKKQRIKLT